MRKIVILSKNYVFDPRSAHVYARIIYDICISMHFDPRNTFLDSFNAQGSIKTEIWPKKLVLQKSIDFSVP